MTSVLKPNAPIFIPTAYGAVEDFSDQWWDLIQSSPYFRDYWLRDCFSDPLDSPFLGDDVPVDSLIDDALTKGESAIADCFQFGRVRSLADSILGAPGKGRNTDMVALGWLKSRGLLKAPRYCEKAPKIVSVRVNPRPIHQPR